MLRLLFAQILGAAIILGGCSGGMRDAPAPSQEGLVDYKAELGLTDEQERELRQLIGDLRHEIEITAAKVTRLNVELQTLIDNEGELELIRTKLEEQAFLIASARYADLAATRKIKALLSPEQFTKWRSIQDNPRQPPTVQERSDLLQAIS